MRSMRALPIFVLVAACGGGPSGNPDGNGSGGGDIMVDTPNAVGPWTIFVIPMENKSSPGIYGNMNDAPYIQGLIGTTGMAAYATKFTDELPALDSEPHYIWMEAGTNVFTDHTFSNDNDASASN